MPRVCDFGGRCRVREPRRYVSSDTYPNASSNASFFWKYEYPVVAKPALHVDADHKARRAARRPRERRPTGRHQNPRREHVRRPRREGAAGAAAARRSAAPEVPRDASPKPQRRALFSGAGRRRNRAAAALPRARARGAAGSDPRRTFPSTRGSRLVSRDPRRVRPTPRAALRPRSTSTTHDDAPFARRRRHETRTVRDLKSATARRVVTSEERSPVSRVFVRSDRRRVDARPSSRRARVPPPPNARGRRASRRLRLPPRSTRWIRPTTTTTTRRAANDAWVKQPPVPASPAPVPPLPVAPIAEAAAARVSPSNSSRVPSPLAVRDHDPTIDDAADEDEMDASDLGDASFDRTVDGDETTVEKWVSVASTRGVGRATSNRTTPPSSAHARATGECGGPRPSARARAPLALLPPPLVARCSRNRADRPDSDASTKPLDRRRAGARSARRKPLAERRSAALVDVLEATPGDALEASPGDAPARLVAE